MKTLQVRNKMGKTLTGAGMKKILESLGKGIEKIHTGLFAAHISTILKKRTTDPKKWPVSCKDSMAESVSWSSARALGSVDTI